MNTSYGLDAYQSHDLNIAMKTSSGDVIKMDFSNEQAGSFSQTKNNNGTSTSASFSSMQSFQFSIESNGISEQDQKEIDGFMKIAQPFIDDFLKELQTDAPNSPVTKLAKQIANIFRPSQERTENETNQTKNALVQTFDNALQDFNPSPPPTSDIQMTQEDPLKKILEDLQKLLEKSLKEFDNFNKSTYA